MPHDLQHRSLESDKLSGNACNTATRLAACWHDLMHYIYALYQLGVKYTQVAANACTKAKGLPSTLA